MATFARTGLPSSRRLLPKSPSSLNPKPILKSDAFSMLRSEGQSLYARVQLMNRLYIITPSDSLLVPRLKDALVGDTLRLTRVLEVGSRSFTLRAPTPFISSKFLERDWQRKPDGMGKGLGDKVHLEATVVEHTKSKMSTKEKFRRRKRYHRTLRQKLEWTRLRIGEIKLVE
ncbi:hypothetical protein BT69DRAFT_1350129 [Atractiella rhizophila]|nr:hypothetical protein BT69DRAFT_1350129 [Atractiella rhizophila]